MTAETKRCPECAEEILAEARRCKHCGHSPDQTRWVKAAGLGVVVVLGAWWFVENQQEKGKNDACERIAETSVEAGFTADAFLPDDC